MITRRERMINFFKKVNLQEKYIGPTVLQNTFTLCGMERHVYSFEQLKRCVKSALEFQRVSDAEFVSSILGFGK